MLAGWMSVSKKGASTYSLYHSTWYDSMNLNLDQSPPAHHQPPGSYPNPLVDHWQFQWPQLGKITLQQTDTLLWTATHFLPWCFLWTWIKRAIFHSKLWVLFMIYLWKWAMFNSFPGRKRNQLTSQRRASNPGGFKSQQLRCPPNSPGSKS